MSRYYYDLHIHSCLSPCADDDMTPANIAGMASLCGLTLVALTDHNTCRNCAPFLKACRQYGIVGVPGMELSTAEDIHLVCLFPTLEAADAFEAEIRPRRSKIKNKTEIFGNQFVMDEFDNVIDSEEDLLLLATDIPLQEGWELAVKHGGAAYPAHIDRESNGIIAILGDMPEQPQFTAIEIQGPENRETYAQKYGCGRQLLVSSDAHNLWSIREKESFLDLDDEPYSSARVRAELIGLIRRGK